MFADVRAKLFLSAIYCANLSPNSGSQSFFWSRRGLGSQDPRIICEYDLATTIAIQTLIQKCTCKMDSSIFLGMFTHSFADTLNVPLPCLCTLFQPIISGLVIPSKSAKIMRASAHSKSVTQAKINGSKIFQVHNQNAFRGFGITVVLGMVIIDVNLPLCNDILSNNRYK